MTARTHTHIQLTLSLSDLQFILDALEEFGDTTPPSESDFTAIREAIANRLPLPDEVKQKIIAVGRESFDEAVAKAVNRKDRSIVLRARLIQAKLNPKEFSVAPPPS
jgi:hypothetical protein